ncbi:MAG: GNAT family N-acetyltransferase, partial [Flavobacteriaceae bacterium]
KKIKKLTFEHSIKKYPNAKIFGITTGLPVMKINYSLGYKPVTFSELTDDEEFWKGCQTCKNYDVLNRTNKEMCLCTGMLYDPKTIK